MADSGAGVPAVKKAGVSGFTKFTAPRGAQRGVSKHLHFVTPWGRAALLGEPRGDRRSPSPLS